MPVPFDGGGFFQSGLQAQADGTQLLTGFVPLGSDLAGRGQQRWGETGCWQESGANENKLTVEDM